MIYIYFAMCIYSISRMIKEIRKKQYKWALESSVFTVLFAIEVVASFILENN
jgi:hypothetical protein